MSGLIQLSSVNITHNHAAVHDDHLPTYPPPSEKQKEMVRDLATVRLLDRCAIHSILASSFPSHLLTLRQVTNLLDGVKRQAQNWVDNLGGDMVAIVEHLMEKMREDD